MVTNVITSQKALAVMAAKILFCVSAAKAKKIAANSAISSRQFAKPTKSDKLASAKKRREIDEKYSADAHTRETWS